jgi:hypothetical protein
MSRKAGDLCPKHSPQNAALHEQRIRRMEGVIALGIEIGWYDRSLLFAGLHQDDVEEYGNRYTRSAGTEINSSKKLLAASAPCGEGDPSCRPDFQGDTMTQAQTEELQSRIEAKIETSPALAKLGLFMLTLTEAELHEIGTFIGAEVGTVMRHEQAAHESGVPATGAGPGGLVDVRGAAGAAEDATGIHGR